MNMTGVLQHPEEITRTQKNYRMSTIGEMHTPIMDDQRYYLPPEWTNDERMKVLMGPMPPDHDAVARNARLIFWAAAIHGWCKAMNKVTFTLQESVSAFRRGAQQPQCLPDILVHMNSLGEALPLDEMPLGERNEESWVGWGKRVFIANPSRFAWQKVKQVLVANNLQGKVFVDTKLLQDMCDNTLKVYWGSLSADRYSKSNPLTVASLYQIVGECVGSADNLHLVIQALAYNGRAVTINHNGTTYVKFPMPGDTRKPVITRIDLAEDDLECAKTQVEANITRLSTEVASLQQEVMSALQAKSKTKALSLLRRRKRVEKSLATQMGALENITSCLLQLQDTQVNKQVLGAFRSGVEAIRLSVAGDQSPDAAATTMDDLQQVLEECQDISSLLATGLGPQGIINDDDDALTEELNDLVSQDQEKNRIDQKLGNRMKGLELPEVPKNNPIASLPNMSFPVLSPP